MRSLLGIVPSLTVALSPAPVVVKPAAPAFLYAAPLAVGPSLTPSLALTLTPLPLPSAPEPEPSMPLPALRAAAALPAELKPDAPSEASRASAAAPFSEALARPSYTAPLAGSDRGERRVRYRLAPLGFEDLTPSEPDVPAAPRVPEPKPFLLRHYRLARFFAAPLVRLVYAVRVKDIQRLPAGPALIVPNHVSFMDPVLLSFATNRPMRFLMYRGIYETRGLQWLFRSLGAIPISPKDPKEVIEDSLYRARRALAAGETVVVFPEGMLTRNGDFGIFRRGFERVAAGTGAPVIPAHIDGMWGSAFSRHPDASLPRGLFARLRGRRRVTVRFGPPLPRADAGLARDAVGLLARTDKK